MNDFTKLEKRALIEIEQLTKEIDGKIKQANIELSAGKDYDFTRHYNVISTLNNEIRIWADAIRESRPKTDSF